MPVWFYQGPLPWPGEECQSPVRGVRAGEYRPGEKATIANITGVMRLRQAGRPGNGRSGETMSRRACLNYEIRIELRYQLELRKVLREIIKSFLEYWRN